MVCSVYFYSLPVSEGRNDKSRCVAKILVRVAELGITDVGEAVSFLLVPTVPKLTQPRERLEIIVSKL